MRKRSHKSLLTVTAMLCALLNTGPPSLTVQAGDVGVTPILEGIGYYEMVDKQGVNGVSIAGGAEIVIFGQGMSHTPTLISAIFTNKEMGQNQGGPPKPSDLAFNSHTGGGKLKYTTPSLMEVHQRDKEAFDTLESVTYEVSLIDFDSMTQQVKTLKCNTPSFPSQFCLLTYSRAYTPILYGITPPVVYSDSEIAFWVDPRFAQQKKSPLLPEFPWVEVRLNGYGVDFEGFIEEDTVLPVYAKSQVRGKMGAISPNASAEVLFRFRVGYAQHMDYQMIRCNYQNTSCYKAKAVGRLDSIDAATGYTTGGQILTIKGHGFGGKKVEALVDGVSCKVFENDEDHFKCITSPNSNPSPSGMFVGQHGLRRKFINSTYELNYANITSSTEFEEKLAMDLETPANVKDGHSGNIYTAYFKAPATANYRFYISCDDACQLYFNNVGKDEAGKTLIYTSDAWTSYRNYFNIPGRKTTKWFSLEADQYYYLEARHIQGTGGDHMSVAVEIDDSNAVKGHHHTMREVQRLVINQDLVRDSTNITITNPDGGDFFITHTDPKTGTTYQSLQLNTNMSAWQIQVRIQSFYNFIYGSWINVIKTMYLDDGNVTPWESRSQMTVFTIQVMRSIRTPSANKITVQKTSGSQITITLPSDYQLSNLPITGNFQIKCALDKEGSQWNLTQGLNQTTAGPGGIRDAIIRACPNYRDNIEVMTGSKYNYNEDGRDFLVRFVGLNYDVPQMEIQSASDFPLVGNNVNFEAYDWIPYNQSRLFYEPVPFEFLYTIENKPQVIVTIDGIEAVCDSLNCGYNYVAPTSMITGFTYDGAILTISGSDFTNTIQSVKFSHIDCTNIQSTSTQITCQVTAVAGSWSPIVTDASGLIPIDSSTTPISVPLTVSSVSPSSNLNPFGGTILTITGSSLPHATTEGNNYSVTFSDGSICNVVSISSTLIRCITSKFDISASTNPTLTVNVNGVTDSSKSVDVMSDQVKVVSITPSSVSPVLKTLLTIKITGYPNTLEKNDLEVFVVSTTRNITTPINIVEVGVDGSDQYLKVKFGGSESSVYDLRVRSRSYGNFDTTGITLTTIGFVTDFNPKSGSVHGGTLITVDGYHFSTDYQDNPIRIGYTDCLVEKSTPTQLQCRTEPRIQEKTGTDDFIVMLKTYEEAVCGFGVGQCRYTWTDDALVQSYSVDFDSTENQYVLTVLGTGFNATSDKTEVLIDNIKQEIISASDTELKVRIVDMMTSTSLNTDIHLPSGHPAGTDDLNYATGIKLTPRIHSLSPNIGSIGGSLIFADVRGIGNMSTGVTLVSGTVDICASVSIKKYGELQCLTKEKIAVADGPLSLKVGTTIYACSGVNSECNYQTSASFITVTDLRMSADLKTVTIVGTNLSAYAADFTGKFRFVGLMADSVTVNSDTEAVATFTNGIPLTTATAQRGYLYFQQINGPQIQQWADSVATLLNKVTTVSIDQSVSCSFAGGCNVQITQTGLTNTLSDSSKNALRVCGKICTPIFSESTSEVTKCALAPLATSQSIDQFSIISESYLIGTPFSSNAALTMSLWDGSNQNGWTSTTRNCHFGTSFRVGYVGVLNEVKYFMGRFNKAKFVGILKFQGSQDGSNYKDIFTVGQEIHEGWNYQNYPKGKELRYRYYRFFGSGDGSCLVGEISLRGYEAIQSTADSYTCQAQLYLNGILAKNFTGSIKYESTLTPLLKSITPRFGSVVGNETVTFEGENFSVDVSDYSVLIDNRLCTVTFANSTHVKCITGKRPGLYPKATLEIKIAGKGKVATQDLVFRYVNYWSEPLTWGGEFAPIEGDMVFIPKGLNLLVDVDSTPILSAVVVEGALVFPSNPNPNHLRTFDAHYVMVRGGIFEAGTEEFPYTSKLVITMHSNRSSPELPIFGNKVIAMYNGLLDLHGVPRNPTWTELDITVEAGSDKITLIRDVDWKVNEEIVIAPTGYFNFEAEQRTIIAVDRTNPSKPILTLDKPLEFQHFAAIQRFGANGQDWIEMRAEVGLLTRNIIYRGDPETSAKNEYGAQIMVHSNGMETLTARIEYVHFFNVGQAFQLGRYPIHFHLIGVVHNSYIRGNAIQQSFNRACTIHGVHYLRVTENVAFNVKGHNFFIEDAAETKNYLEKNLAIWTRKSWSLLNSDQTPASFWITHPDNIFRGNHAAGSDNYGYWFDTKPNPTGPSFDPNICPENSPLGEFSNNVAHSNGRYGLRIFHKLLPRTNPCVALSFDIKNTTDPYWRNPPIAAVFQNFTSFKNRRNGAIALDIGQVRFENFKVSDNILAGIEVELSDTMVDGYAMVNGALIIGRSNNADEMTNEAPSHGVIGPRTEGFQVHNVKFYNFDIADKAALGTCSHCFSAPSTDSGGRTVTVSGLYFDSSVKVKIRYQEPWREIFYDLDGSLTGLGANSYATSYWRHNVQPECKVDKMVYDGILCDNRVQVRRLVFYNYAPDIFTLMEMKVLPIDDSIIGSMNNVTKLAYYNNISAMSILPFRPKANPMRSWAVPIVTGHKYKIHWQKGLDFTRMQIDLSPHWKTTDKDVYFVHNFTDVRVKYDFLTGRDNIQNGTLFATNNSLKQTGAFSLFNETATRELHFIINGKNATRNNIVMQSYRCIGPCLAAVAVQVVETNVRLWSNPASWKSGKVPLAGEDVVVEPGYNVVYDLEESPIYRYVQINGRLTFKQDAPKLHLQANYLFVRMGELIIGNETNPYLGNATITLYGMKQDEQIVYDNAIESGNKVLANTAIISIFGRPRKVTRSRLLNTILPGNTTFTIEAGLDWQVGEQVSILSTSIRWNELDTGLIASYNNETGVVTLDRKMSYYHWGALVSTGAQYNGVDMRAEVMLLSRNIKIQGNNTDAWGCQILTSDFVEGNLQQRIGRTVMDNVEIYNCSQYDTWKAAIRFEGHKLGFSRISNSSIHHGLGVAVNVIFSQNVEFLNNNVYTFTRYGMVIQTSDNVTFDNNWVAGIFDRGIRVKSGGDTQAAICACGHTPNDRCFNLTVTNNIASSVQFAIVDTTGFSVPHFECNSGDSSPVFRDNIAHSINGYGAIIYRNDVSDIGKNCIAASRFTAYKNQFFGIITNQATNNVQFSNMTFIDNGHSLSANVGLEGDDQSVKLKNILFYGETEARDCKYQNQCEDNDSGGGCYDKSAIMPSSYAGHSKPPLISTPTGWPQYKIKADCSLGGKTTYENLQFINFKSAKTWCGTQQRLFVLNPTNADYLPQTKFFNTRFENVAQDTLAYLFTPPNEWSVVDDCGQFPCTGPLNTLLTFEKSTFAGYITPSSVNSNFQIISGNDQASSGFTNCQKVSSWNGYYCNNDDLTMLTWESQDADRRTRLVTPIEVIGMNLTTRNVINTFMDHQWDGFYTSMLRTSRFITILQGGNGMWYELVYKGTPPLRQKFTLRSDTVPVALRIKYPKAGVYILKDVNGREITANAWDNTIQAPGLIKGARGGYCGENRYLGGSNILEFYMTKNCTIFIEPIDSIQASVRMNWTMKEFFSDGGTTKFVDRIAASLGIRAANIKVVSVYMGSVVVDFQVVEDTAKTLTKQGGLDNVQKTLTSQLTSKSIDLGAPILNVQVAVAKASSSATNSQTVSVSTFSTSNANNPIVNPLVIMDPTYNPKGGQVFPTIVTNTKPTVQSIVNSTTINIVKTQVEGPGSGSNGGMIAAIVSIVAVILVGGVIGYFVYRKYQRKIIELTEAKAKPVDQSHSTRVHINATSPNVCSPGGMEDDEGFEEQYHPQVVNLEIFNGDFLKKKVNDADHVDEQCIESSEDDDQSSSAREGSGGSNGGGVITQQESNLVTQARISRIREDAPLSTFSDGITDQMQSSENSNDQRNLQQKRDTANYNSRGTASGEGYSTVNGRLAP